MHNTYSYLQSMITQASYICHTYVSILYVLSSGDLRVRAITRTEFRRSKLFRAAVQKSRPHPQQHICAREHVYNIRCTAVHRSPLHCWYPLPYKCSGSGELLYLILAPPRARGLVLDLDNRGQGAFIFHLEFERKHDKNMPDHETKTCRSPERPKRHFSPPTPPAPYRRNWLPETTLFIRLPLPLVAI